MPQQPVSPKPNLEYIDKEALKINIAKAIILTIVTCGLYNIYWQYLQMNTVNLLLGRQQFSFMRWFLLTLVTCGLYHIYHEYVFGRAISEAQQMYEVPVPGENLATTSLILSIIGLAIISDAIQQREINNTIDAIP